MPGTTSGTGIAAYKAAAWVVGVSAGFLTLSAVVVMLMTHPRTRKEWAVGLISTVVGSLGGGAFAIRWLEIQSWVHDPFGLVGIGGVIFACGLPGWAIVRAVFNYIEKNKDATIKDVIQDVKEVI